MNIVCIANDIPLPANSGGRVDVWRRLCAFKAAGHKIFLLCWVDIGRVDPPSEAIMNQLRRVCEDIKWLPIRRSGSEIMRRSFLLWRWPSHVAARWVTADIHAIYQWAQSFNPQLVWLDGLYGGAVAQHLAQMLGKPLWYRSHNIEHHYMAAQRARENRFIRRLGLWANCLGLERFERSLISHAQKVFDISQSDAQFWREQKLCQQVNWLPTLVDPEFCQRLADSPKSNQWDIVYFGNLTTPNNIEAVFWLVQQVLPQLPDAALKIAIAGSNPAPAVIKVLATDTRITLIANPLDMTPIIGSARVLVNPMQAGSGVNLKSVEMLFTDAALVSTQVGAGGLPAQVQACFALADEPGDFARAISQALNENINREQRLSARSFFSFSAINNIFTDLECI